MLKKSFAHAAGILRIASSVSLAVACKGSPTATESRGTSTAAAPAPAAVPVQVPAFASAAAPVGAEVQRGAGRQAPSCATCHRVAGEGSAQAPALIGPGAQPTNPPAGRRLRTGTFSSPIWFTPGK